MYANQQKDSQTNWLYQIKKNLLNLLYKVGEWMCRKSFRLFLHSLLDSTHFSPRCIMQMHTCTTTFTSYGSVPKG